MSRWYVPALVLALAGCGADESAVEKCDDLVNVVCDRGVQCLGGTQSECVQQVRQVLPCGSAKTVSASYDRCIDQLNADSCSVLFPPDPQTGQPSLTLPADCMSVILTRGGSPLTSSATWAPVSLATEVQ